LAEETQAKHSRTREKTRSKTKIMIIMVSSQTITTITTVEAMLPAEVLP
jgi:hypothetical protein